MIPVAALDELGNTGKEDAAAKENSASASKALLVGSGSQYAEDEYGEPLILSTDEEPALSSMEVAAAKHRERADALGDAVAKRLVILKQLTGTGKRGRPK